MTLSSIKRNSVISLIWCRKDFQALRYQSIGLPLVVRCSVSVMLNYADEYCDARQAAVTVIRSSDAALKSCLEWLTMSYIISDSAYLISV